MDLYDDRTMATLDTMSREKKHARNLERLGAFTQHRIEESEVFASMVLDRNPRRRRPPRPRVRRALEKILTARVA